MGSAVPLLQQLKLVQLQHKADTNTHAWQRLLDLLLQLPEHAESTQQAGEAAAVLAGIPGSEAAQLGRRQAAGLQTCLAALLPPQSLMTQGIRRQTSRRAR